jgi:pilus assembly protein CpaE
MNLSLTRSKTAVTLALSKPTIRVSLLTFLKEHGDRDRTGRDAFSSHHRRFFSKRALARYGTPVALGFPMIVSFLGTKGGTGTTTLTVNCAADVRRITGRPTVVVDLKNGPGDVALFLGLRPRHSLLTALDHLAWTDPSSLSRYVVEHECGLHVLAAGDEFGRPAPREADGVEHTLRALNTVYDYVILDCGTSLMMPTSGAMQLSDSILLVANPDVPCLRNLQRLIDAVKAAGVANERLQIVLNRASEFGVLSTAQIERVLGLNISFSVNSDYRTVASAVNSGVPVSALCSSELNAQLDMIARAIVTFHELTQASTDDPPPRTGSGIRRQSAVRVVAT